jgi:hypothetical protein
MVEAGVMAMQMVSMEAFPVRNRPYSSGTGVQGPSGP